jgi:hypothetical protein
MIAVNAVRANAKNVTPARGWESQTGERSGRDESVTQQTVT